MVNVNSVKSINTEGLLELLHKGVVQIQFVKVDKTLRDMLSTLSSDYLPNNPSYSEAKQPEDRITVWDIESEGWRTIKLDSIVKVQIPDEGSK